MQPPSITQAFPPMALGKLVAQIKDFDALPPEQQQAFVEELVNIHPVINLHWGPGHRFRRVRWLKSTQRPESVDDVIWPKNGIPKLGRANPEGLQVLYLADRQDTALQETRHYYARDEGWVVIAEFEIRIGQSIFICPVGELNQILRTGRGFLSGDCSDAISGMMNACPKHDALSLVIADSFLYELMAEQDDHRISSMVAYAFFKKLDRVSAIAYSSRRQRSAINLAVKTEGFWSNWGVSSVRHAFAKHLAQGFYELSDVTSVVGITHSGKFLWNDHTSDPHSITLLSPPYYPHEV